MRDCLQHVIELCSHRQAQKLRISARAFLRHELDAIANQIAPAELYEV
ncbi:MAG: hypothetical protein O9309_03505 [Rhizobium sp.]|nr:hypothetical protein [Rhizobium sp.]MCZ8351407.1 hypothetical protein [Rhizobium sp.]